jgi:hypothetical protein
VAVAGWQWCHWIEEIGAVILVVFLWHGSGCGGCGESNPVGPGAHFLPVWADRCAAVRGGSGVSGMRGGSGWVAVVAIERGRQGGPNGSR